MGVFNACPLTETLTWTTVCVQKYLYSGKESRWEIIAPGRIIEIRKISLRRVERTVSYFLHHLSPRLCIAVKRVRNTLSKGRGERPEHLSLSWTSIPPRFRSALVNHGAWLVPMYPGTGHAPVPDWPMASGSSWHPYTQPSRWPPYGLRPQALLNRPQCRLGPRGLRTRSTTVYSGFRPSSMGLLL